MADAQVSKTCPRALGGEGSTPSRGTDLKIKYIILKPAKELGFKTALVWAKEKDKPSYVDFLLPTVYDVLRIIY